MEKAVAFCAVLVIVACASETGFRREELGDVFVKDFRSDEPAACTTRDVDLGHSDAKRFFQKARLLDYRTLTDNYPIAPCYIEGTAMYRGGLCEWKIRAAATGSMKCEGREWYFACDECDELFARDQPPGAPQKLR